LPDFVHGQLGAQRTAEIRDHLVECAECAAEVELLRLVVTSAAATPEMDVERIASGLPTATRHGFMLHRGSAHTLQPTASATKPAIMRSSRAWSRPAVKIAAAVAIVIAGGLSLLVGRDVLRPEAQVGQAPQQQTRQVAVASVASLSLAGELQELSDERLVTLLGEMDHMDGLLAAEPEALEPATAAQDSSEVD
jgi:anti-sigma factor RsiW